MANSGLTPPVCVVDTDIVIDFIRRKGYAQDLLRRWGREGLLAISVVTHIEVHRGMRPGEEEVTQDLLQRVQAVPVDVTLARRAGALLREQRARGVTLAVTDGVIAATALTLEVPLLTNNVRHYPFPGLNVVKGAPA